MFGANKPFGFGGGTGTSFGASTPFGGGTTSTFGAKPTGTATTFGTPAFGSQTPASGGLFGGNANTQQTGGLFGGTSFSSAGGSGGFSFGSQPTTQTTSLFASSSTGGGGLFATPSTSSAFGAKTPGFGVGNTSFGGTSTGTSLFGSTTQTSTGTLPFGTTGTTGGSSLFGGGADTSFGGTSTGTSLFGSTTHTSTGTLPFGTTGTTGGSSLFGGGAATAFGTAQTGTTVKFNPLPGSDNMLKNGVSQTINTKHQCITAMKEYESKSLEELRMEDYAANRKGPQQGATAGTGLFGNTQTGQTSAFGFGQPQQQQQQQQQTTGGFGSGKSFGNTSTGLFGQQQNTGGSSLFGQTKPTFGTATTTAASTGFGTGFGTTSTGGGTSLFGQQQSKPLFGNTTTSQAGGIFGQTSTASTGFGTGGFGTSTGFNSTQTGGLFGQKPLGFGTTSTATTNTGTTFGFGQTNSSLFAKPTTSTGFGFGQSTGFNANTGSTLFGNKPAGFGAASTGFGNALGGLSTGTSFNFNATDNKPAFGTGLNLGGFGQTGGLGATTTLSTAGATLGSNTDAAILAAQQAQIQQQLMALASAPYGDSPLFRNLKLDPSKREDMKPTNPLAQKAALNTSSQYKVSSRPSAKIKPKPLHSLVNGKAQLFDGLEEEDCTFGNDTFVPRRSVKKLVIKNNRNGSSPPSRSSSQIEGDLEQTSPFRLGGARNGLSLQDEQTPPPVIKNSQPITQQRKNVNGDTPGPRPSLDDSIAALNAKNTAKSAEAMKRDVESGGESEEEEDSELSSSMRLGSAGAFSQEKEPSDAKTENSL
ncbi:nuclear pore complex protein Nup98-Nup96-like [Lingula anatina]|uniref:Nuclear pore complex protein Nup98-Nup96 n=1 Tax=Lingula anatina TaxID=7574 RepID=A0A1S3JEL3_LINAN|nr:nuclear pore complex protein Nup98-Nup96-like [Lingula anatina]|eukprot:XP_013408855.1 nuclear pore complex protein Nup98-Nup96-like [Lingula anatina]